MSNEPSSPVPTEVADAKDSRAENASDQTQPAERSTKYVARILQQHLVDNPETRAWTGDGTAAFVDVSGFTKLSERLARKGREGAEQITDAIGGSFEAILEVAYENGGSLLKFGGDALLLWFEGAGHLTRACRAAILMRRRLRTVGRIDVPGARVTLRMSQGVHTGRFHFFAVGRSHTELLTTGPAWSRLVTMEQAASAGEIVVSPETAALLSDRCLGDRREPGVLLRREPPGFTENVPLKPRPKMSAAAVTHCLPPAVRQHLLGGGGTPEHRPVTVAFLRFTGTDASIAQLGMAATAETLDRLVTVVVAEAEAQGVSFLASDVDADGGKLILAAGAPKTTGDDEERMLLALRRIVETGLPISVQVGVHRGFVFAGDIGPFYRRTYTVMGDVVNLSARLMAGAKPGAIYATADVLDRSNTLFEVEELEPFAVKGKAKPIKAWSVRQARGSRTRNVTLQSLPLVGRDAELGVLRAALAGAQAGAGRLIELVGEPGIGKTRLLEALREGAAGFHLHHAVCEAYTASTPYAVWRELLREFMGFGRDDPDKVVVERLRAELALRAPDLAPWLPLIAIAFGLEIPPTPEVLLLAEKNRRAKLHEALLAFLDFVMPGSTLVEIENVHHMDLASAELLSYIACRLEARPWLVAVALRPSETGFAAPEATTVQQIELDALAAKDTQRLAQLATEKHPLPMHVLQIVAERSGGNPQFLLDLVHSAIETGGVGRLPDSAEAAAIARIDGLAPEDRNVVRRAAVFGLTFHPRMLAWLAGGGEENLPGPSTWQRLQDFFDEEPDGYLRFRRSLLRQAAYEGLPYTLRRRLHGAVASRIAKDAADIEESADTLSLHYFIAGDNRSAWQFATIAGKRATAVYAYVEAARLYARAMEAGRKVGDLGAREIAAVQEALGDSWHRAGDFRKATEAFKIARRLAAGDRLKEAELLLKRSWQEEKLGNCPRALRWAAQAIKALDGLQGTDAARQLAQLTAWYAAVLQIEGRSSEAARWARKAVANAEAVDDPDALGAACFALGWATGDLGKESAEPYWQRSLEAYRKSGNMVRQAGLLSNLGVVCGWEGRWDEAVSYYEQARELALKIGNLGDAEIARTNIGEILADQGRLDEAEALLQESLPNWRALNYVYFLGYCISILGRVALRSARFDEAIGRFGDARSKFLEAGSQPDALEAEARIAECRAFMRESETAHQLASATLERTEAKNTKLVALLERVRGQSLMQRGDIAGARRALESSLIAARARRDPFEVVQTLLATIELDRLAGIDPPTDILTESRGLLADLKIRGVPAMPPSAR